MPKREVKIIYTLIAALFIAFLAVPLISLLAYGFQSNGSFSLAAITQVFSHSDFFPALGNSFIISAVTGVMTTVLAFLMAYTVHYTNLPKWLKGFIVVFSALPMLFPTITYGFAIIYSLGKQGLITSLLGGQPFSIYGFNGLLLGYVAYTLPTAFLLLHNSFKYIDKKFLTVSELMGDSPLRQFSVTVLRPMIATIGTAFIQTFFLCFTDYGIPAAVGGDFTVISTTLYNQMLGASPNFNKGAVVAMVMLLPSIISIIIQNRLDKTNFRYNKISKVELKKNPLRDGVFGTISIGCLLLILSLFLVVFLVPFVTQWPYDKTFSLANFFGRLGDRAIRKSLFNSVTVAFITAAVGTVIAFLCGLLTERSKAGKGVKNSVYDLSLIANTIPGMVLGVAFMLTFSGTPLQNTLWIIILSNIIHFFSTPYFMAKNALNKMNNTWETTAELMGDSWLKTVFRVLIPNSVKTLAEIFGYYFVNAMVTVSAVIFLAGARSMVLTTKIKEYQHYGKFEEIFVMSLLIFAINLLIKLVVGFITKEKRKKKEQ